MPAVFPAVPGGRFHLFLKSCDQENRQAGNIPSFEKRMAKKRQKDHWHSLNCQENPAQLCGWEWYPVSVEKKAYHIHFLSSEPYFHKQ